MSENINEFLRNKRSREEDKEKDSANLTKDSNIVLNKEKLIPQKNNSFLQDLKPNSRKLLEKILDDTERRDKKEKKDIGYNSNLKHKSSNKDQHRHKDENVSISLRNSDDKYKLIDDPKDKSKDKTKPLEKECRDREENIKDKDFKLSNNLMVSNNSINNTNLLNKNKNENLQKPKKDVFIMDEQGRIVDDKGNIIQIKVKLLFLIFQPQTQSTLKININKEKEQRVKELLKNRKIDQFEARSKGFKFFDPNLENKTNKREKMRLNAFNFSEMDNKLNDTTNYNNIKSPFIIPEKNSDVKILLESHIKNLSEINQETQNVPNIQAFPHHHKHKILSRTINNNLKKPVKFRAEDLIPDVEWWDSYFLPQGKKSFSPYWFKDENGNFLHNLPEKIELEDFKIEEEDFLSEKITIYIQHPIQIKNEYIEKMNKITMPVFLTQKERKRIRRLRRQDKEKDKQEKIRLGLEKPDPPKLKFNNFMRILGDSAVQDPSQVEKIVRKAYEDRYRKMMQENEKNKLSKDQKAEKVRKKFERDIKKDCKACLFKITDLSNRKIRFKIDKNSQQLYLTGCCITNKKNNVDKIPTFIYVEGGPLALKKYKNLLLRRINWNSNNIKKDIEKEEESESDEEENIKSNSNDLKNSKHCMLVWEGTIKKRAFEKWKTMEVNSEIRARKILSDKGMEHYWNLILSYNYEE